jgi:hypothetical protein
MLIAPEQSKNNFLSNIPALAVSRNRLHITLPQLPWSVVLCEHTIISPTRASRCYITQIVKCSMMSTICMIIRCCELQQRSSSHLILALGANDDDLSSFQLDRDIFIFGGGNKRLRNVTNLYCQCQISQRRS